MAPRMTLVTPLICLAVFSKAAAEQGQFFAVKIDDNDRVKVQLDGTWGYVHGVGWDDVAANVVCKSLGYNKGWASRRYFDDHRSSKIIYNVRCSGVESELSACNYTTEKPFGASYLFHAAVAKCINQQTTFSLVGGTDSQSGWVMATKGNHSGLVCENSYFGPKENAPIVCVSLGFEWGEEYPMTDKPIGNAMTAEINCQGEESDFISCVKGDWAVKPVEECVKPVSVYCYRKVRLSPLVGKSLGNVVIVNRDIEYNFCADGFDATAANVVCRQLGFPSGGEVLSYNPFKDNYYKQTYISVQCAGDEEDLMSCTFSDLTSEFYESCKSMLRVATVKCSGEENEDFQVRLDGENILLSQYGLYGKVHFNGFHDSATDLVCRNLRDRETGMTRKIYADYDRKMATWLLDVSCADSDKSLGTCSHSTPEVDLDKYYYLTAGAFCYNYDEVTTLRLEGEKKKNSGQVVATYNGTTGVVCSNIWTENNVNVICRQLGYSYGLTSYYEGKQRTHEDVLFATIECGYYDRTVDMCRKEDWKKLKGSDIDWEKFEHPCYGNLQGAYCHNGVMLHPGQGKDFGIVSIYQSVWSPLCDKGFDEVAAGVVCRELGLSSKGILVPKNTFPYGGATTPYNVNISCTGQEKTILDCIEKLQTGDCGENSNYASIVCSDSTNGTIEFVGQDDKGRVIVSKYGINGTICSFHWDDTKAAVFCRQMGYDGGSATSVFPYYSIIRPRWINAVWCRGYEASILDCPYSTEITYGCIGANDAGATCRNN